jgi:hypothetical protein
MSHCLVKPSALVALCIVHRFPSSISDNGAAKESHGLTFFTPFWNNYRFRLCFMIVDAFEDCLVGNTLSRVTAIALL